MANKKEFTAQQKEAIYTNKTAVVSAGAGSGKTTVLSERFLRLVLDGIPVDEILTLTFTKKATAEMFERIYISLLKESEAALDPRNKTILQKAVNDFFKARIETLDSFCASIVRPHAAHYGITPEFTEDAEKSSALVDEVSLSFVIEKREHTAIKELYREYTPDRIAKDIFSASIKNNCFLGNEPCFSKDYEAALKTADGVWKEFSSGIISMLDALSDAYDNLPKDKKTKPLELSNIIFDNSSNEKIMQTLSLLYPIAYANQNANPWRQLKSELSEIRRAFLDFSALAVFFVQKEHIKSLCALLDEAANIVFEKKRQSGVLSYSDVSSLALTILRDNKEARREEKCKFKKIIIDEFQDNNSLQRDILFLLAEKEDAENDGVPEVKDLTGGKLFFVGDQKQSIYKFRGADVSVFRGLEDSFQDGCLTMQDNFRSHRRLIGAFNAIFGGTAYSETEQKMERSFPGVFAPEQFLPPYEAEYIPLNAPPSSKSAEDGKMTFCILPVSNIKDDDEYEDEDEDDLTAIETEAVFIANKIKELHAKWKYGDIAILVRSHTHEKTLEKYLRLADIPYQNENTASSLDVDPICDIYSILRLAAFPEDKLSFMQFLRSAFVDMSFDEAFLALKEFETAKKEHDKNMLPFGNIENIKDENTRKKLYSAKLLYDTVRNMTVNNSITNIIHYLWNNAGFRYETLWNNETKVYAASYNILFALARSADKNGMNLALWTEELKNRIASHKYYSASSLSGSNSEDINVPLEKENAVTIMTIHKSKGLEFPVVIVPSCGNGRKQAERSFAYRTAQGFLTIKPVFPAEFAQFGAKKVKGDYFREHCAEDEEAKNLAELRRLLYVAMTRAESELYITGAMKYKETDDASDFKTLIKSVAERLYGEAMEKNENRIEGDSVISNGQFFGLLLPCIAERLDEGFFSIEEIPQVDHNNTADTKQVENKKLQNNKEGLRQFINSAKVFYENKNIITPEKYPERHIGVSALKENNNSIQFNSGGVSNFTRISEMQGSAVELQSKMRGGLSAEDFGTVVHSVIEALLNNTPLALPPIIEMQIAADDLDGVLNAANSLVAGFLASPLGIAAENAVWRKTETPFRILENAQVNNVFINGVFDLIFENNGIVYIVDFKTDKVENPEEHLLQLQIYRKAALAIWQKETRAFIYYLRSGGVWSLGA